MHALQWFNSRDSVNAALAYLASSEAYPHLASTEAREAVACTRDLITALRESAGALTPVPTLPFPDSLIGSILFEGYATTWGHIHAGVPLTPGSFAPGLPGFIAAGGALTFRHQEGYPLGRIIAAEEDSYGVRVTGVLYLPTESYQSDIRRDVLRGTLRTMSKAWS